MELDLMVVITRALFYKCVSVPLYIIVPVQVKGRQERSGTVKHLEVRYKSTNRPNQTHQIKHLEVRYESTNRPNQIHQIKPSPLTPYIIPW